MTPEEKVQLEARITRLEGLVNQLIRNDRYQFSRPIVGGADGLTINANATQKLGFWGTTPAARDTFHYNTAINSGVYDSAAELTLNHIRLALISYGLITT